ncbi:MAG: redoxin domain-containing protein [Alphaproteobacteria bacterium]|nr:redoxin domain-containing protein [Alphaproteobacteria bacterium]
MKQAPEWTICKWLNTDEDITLQSLQGKVVAAFAFQMLCPGCVEHSIPQARRVNAMFSKDDVAVIGLHTVFEHHSAMGENSLVAFMHEYGITFPVGIDIPSGDDKDPIPKTMRAYNMGGTPTLLLIDRQGRLRKHKMGHEHDLILGAELMSLMRETE